MEISEINMLSDFEAGMKSLQNPSFISRLSSYPSFWQWSALILAIFATFTSVIKRIKIIFIHFHTVKSISNQKGDVVEFSDDEDDDCVSSDDEQEEDCSTTSFGAQRRVDEDFCVRGSILSFKNQWPNGKLRQRRRRSNGGAWSEFARGKNVVKLWDSLGLSLDIDEDLFNYDPKTVISTWDSHHEEKSGESSDRVWGCPAAPPPTVLLMAESNGNGDGVILGGYDARLRSGVPALYAKWNSTTEKVGGVSATGVSKVYVRDDVSGVLTVGDVRNMRRPLESVNESDGDTWWDADAVIVEKEFDSSK